MTSSYPRNRSCSGVTKVTRESRPAAALLYSQLTSSTNGWKRTPPASCSSIPDNCYTVVVVVVVVTQLLLHTVPVLVVVVSAGRGYYYSAVSWVRKVGVCEVAIFGNTAANFWWMRLWVLKISILPLYSPISENGIFIPKFCIFGRKFVTGQNLGGAIAPPTTVPLLLLLLLPLLPTKRLVSMARVYIVMLLLTTQLWY